MKPWSDAEEYRPPRNPVRKYDYFFATDKKLREDKASKVGRLVSGSRWV